MSATPRFRPAVIEPLEDRIAPALLVKGANLLGLGGPTTGETSVGENSVTLVKVLSGRALVWFDGDVITGISVGPGTKLDITGAIYGDIVANLEADGTLSDSDNDPTNGEDGNVLLPNDILGIKTRDLGAEKGSIANIITGGSVANVDLSGSLFGIYAGDGVFRSEYNNGTGTGIVVSDVGIDINPIQPGVGTAFVLDRGFNTNGGPLLKPGASITNVHITEARSLEIFAGNGANSFANATAGGSISNLRIDAAIAPQGVLAYHLIAGDGGDGKKGGAGGSITNVVENNSPGEVRIMAGNGGIGIGAAGGIGGSVVGLDLQSSSTIYNVFGGNGGDGTPAGAGGRLVNNNFANRTPVTGVLLAADFNDDGYDDVVVADSGTGKMVVEENLGDTTGGFSPFVQYTTGGVAITQIDAAGTNPIDAQAIDLDNSGFLDILVTYKDGTIAVFLNQGVEVNGVVTNAGVFYDATLNNGTGGFDSLVGSIGFTPSKVALVAPRTLAIAENVDGKGTMHFVGFDLNDTETGLEVVSFVSSLKYTAPIVDLVGNYIGLSDGTIIEYTYTILPDGVATTADPLPNYLTGGLIDLDLDGDGSRLLAVSSEGRMAVVYDITTNDTSLLATLALDTVPGKPLVGKFTHDDDAATEDEIVILTGQESGAQFVRYIAGTNDQDPSTPAYIFDKQIGSLSRLKNFVPIYSPDEVSFAALTGSLSELSIIADLETETVYPLPFGVKEVHLTAGNGGDGLDVGTKLGKGGDGGSISGANVDAILVEMIAGEGGDSNQGAAGKGGSITNNGAFATSGGVNVVAKLTTAELVMIAGNGGTPATATAAKTAAGGAGGSVSGITIEFVTDLTVNPAPKLLQITSGVGGDGKGGVAGAGGAIANVKINAGHANLQVTAGNGGSALLGTGNGGAGGAITNLQYELLLESEVEKLEYGYFVTLTSGTGGASTAGTGGAGGAVSGVSLKVDGADSTNYPTASTPSPVNTERDSTVVMSVTAGDGGAGNKAGGAGGSILNFTTQSHFDQLSVNKSSLPNYIVLSLLAGSGGDSTVGNGGNGGTIQFSKAISGITFWDMDADIFDPNSPSFAPDRPALLVVAGDGGNGGTKGGLGGSVIGLTAQNSKFFTGQDIAANLLESAVIRAGNGGNGSLGNGGDGGAVKNTLVGVYHNVFDIDEAESEVRQGHRGFLEVSGGNGGISTTAKGGNGGAVSNGEFGLVGTFLGLGIEVRAGDGGTGSTLGGAGGTLGGGAGSIRVNTPQSTEQLSAFLYAGNGGAATGGGGIGGKGGDVNGVLQAKDFNSSINLIQAGNGGDAGTGRGGAGGNVLNVKTVGFLGRPSDGNGNFLGGFDERVEDDDYNPNTPDVVTEFAQGVFSGRGGVGQGGAGLHGSLSGIAARQIAAMAAAVDPLTGLFAVAPKVSNVTASVIGYDLDRDGNFDSENGQGTSPATAVPVDGFILAAALSKVTGARPQMTFNA